MLHILDKQTDLILGVLDNTLDEGKVFREDTHTDSGNNYETFDFMARADVKMSKHLSARNRLVIPGDRPGTWCEFIIFNIHELSGGWMEIKTNGSYVELAKEQMLPKFDIGTVSTQTAMEYGLTGTEWRPGLIEDGGNRRVQSVDRLDRYAYLHKIAGIYGMNLRFRIEVQNNQVVGRYVDFIGREGFFNGKEIELGKDLIGVERHDSSEEVATALVVEGPVKEDQTRISITVEDEDARQRWGRNGRHIWGYHEIDSENANMPESEVLQYGRTALKKRISSVVKYTVTAAAMDTIFKRNHEKVFKGDKVRIKDTSFVPALYLDATVIEVKRSVSKKGAKEFVLGDFTEYTEDEVMALYRKLRAQLIAKVDRGEVVEIINENEIPRQPFPPEDPTIDMLWLDTSYTPYRLKMWNGTIWKNATPTVPSDIGAVPPSYVDQAQIITQYKMEHGTIEETISRMDAEVAALQGNQYLTGTGAATALNDAQVAFHNQAAVLINALNGAITDNNVSQVENTAVSAHRTEYRTALNALIAAIRAAEDEIVKQSANEVMEFGDRTIFKGATIPAAEDTQELDLWLDGRVSPPVWRQYLSGVWVQTTRTNLSDMQGQITETQVGNDIIKTQHLATNAVTAKHIAANVINSNMITTAGLDAAVITYGTMTGITADVGQAGMTAVGTLSTSTRFWAGASFSNRGSAPFRVSQSGAVYASNLVIAGGSISGVSIDVSTDIKVGRRLIIGAGSDEKRIDFGGHAAWIYSTYGNLYIETGQITTYGTLKAFEFNGSRLWNAGVLKLEAGQGELQIRTSTTKELHISGQNGSGTLIKWTATGLQFRTDNDGLFASISASKFVVNSLRETKVNIEELAPSIGKIRQPHIYTYESIDPEKGREGEVNVGIMVDEAPTEVLDVTGKGIDIYGYVALLHKAVQELTLIVEKGLTPGGLRGEPIQDINAAQQMNHALRLVSKTLPEAEALEIAAIFPEWTTEKTYKVGDKLRYGKNADGEDQLFTVLQGHKSQAAWNPPAAVSLFKKLGFTPTGTPVWVQPLGSTDAYKKNDVVSHKGSTYVSDIDANVWEPGVYGWKLK